MPFNKNNLELKVKLIAKNGAAELNLHKSGRYFIVKRLSKNSRVKRLTGVSGIHAFLEPCGSTYSKWVALNGDPDYKVRECGV